MPVYTVQFIPSGARKFSSRHDDLGKPIRLNVFWRRDLARLLLKLPLFKLPPAYLVSTAQPFRRTGANGTPVSTIGWRAAARSFILSAIDEATSRMLARFAEHDFNRGEHAAAAGGYLESHGSAELLDRQS